MEGSKITKLKVLSEGVEIHYSTKTEVEPGVSFELSHVTKSPIELSSDLHKKISSLSEHIARCNFILGIGMLAEDVKSIGDIKGAMKIKNAAKKALERISVLEIIVDWKDGEMHRIKLKGEITGYTNEACKIETPKIFCDGDRYGTHSMELTDAVSDIFDSMVEYINNNVVVQLEIF